MPALAVVEDLHVLEEGRASLALALEGPAGEECALEGGEEPLGHGVVRAIPHRPHGAADTHRLAALPTEH